MNQLFRIRFLNTPVRVREPPSSINAAEGSGTGVKFNTMSVFPSANATVKVPPPRTLEKPLVPLNAPTFIVKRTVENPLIAEPVEKSVHECGGMPTDALKRLKDLEKENLRLKKAVADLTLDKAILKEIAEGKW